MTSLHSNKPWLALAAGVAQVFSKDEVALVEGKRNPLSAFAKIKAEYDRRLQEKK